MQMEENDPYAQQAEENADGLDRYADGANASIAEDSQRPLTGESELRTANVVKYEVARPVSSTL